MKNRLILTLCFVAAWTVGIGARLYQLQVEDHADYQAKATRQQQRRVKFHAPRGIIYDARGRELAVSVEVESAYAVPAEVADPSAAARALAPILGVEERGLAERLAVDAGFVWVGRRLDSPVSEAVRKLALSGIYFLPESKRYYPFGELAAGVLGYVGTDNQGLAGLELVYDSFISGKPAWRTLLQDARHGSLVRPELSSSPDAQSAASASYGDRDPALDVERGKSVGPEPGEDLYLTLDASIQYLAEKELRGIVTQSRARAGSVVLLDARDSAVLAMASYPTFDPNYFGRYPKQSWRNRPVMDAYEPGSTFKAITAAAAIMSRVVEADDLFDCQQGGITVSRSLIRDHQPFDILTFREVIAQSSNVGAIKTAHRVGSQRFYRTILDFGFGRPTGVDLPGESAGILHPLEKFSELATAYAAFGQGISVTPLQLANAFAALANGGRQMRPYVALARGRPGHVVRLRPGRDEIGEAVPRRTAVEVVDVLESAVIDGTGKQASIPGYRVAGKTGTAQTAALGGYSATRYVASFVGFAPARRPRIVGLVLLDEPQGTIHGSDVAAPAFAAIVGPSLLYLGVAPDPELRPQESAWMQRPKRRQAKVVVSPLTESPTGP